MDEFIISSVARVESQLIERLTLEFPSDQRKVVLDWLYEQGYTLGRCGPKPIGVGKVDPNTQLYVAEKVIEIE